LGALPVALYWNKSNGDYEAYIGSSLFVLSQDAGAASGWSASFAGAPWSVSGVVNGFVGSSAWDPSSSAFCVFTSQDFGDAWNNWRIGQLVLYGYAGGWVFLAGLSPFVVVVRWATQAASGVFS
jgi:hypothetical protein